MARKSGNEITTTADLGLAPEIEELTVEETEAPADEKVASIEPVNLPENEKMVKIATNFTGTLHVGGKNWHFKKEEPVNVPKSVKDILFVQKGLAPI